MTRTLLIAALMFPALAAAEVPESGPVLIGPAPQIVRGGVGNQTDPHVSGSVVSYTALEGTSSEIRYQDLTDPSTDVAIPNGGHRDSLSDVSGEVLVFRRVFTDGSTSGRPIMFFDQAQAGLGVRELAPLVGARRAFASAGGDTVAFMQYVGASSTQSEICVASLTAWTAPAQCLTADGLNNRDPAVSPNGNTVTWAKCQTSGDGCDIYVAVRSIAGVWGAPVQLTSSPGEEILPDTNGTIVTYSSNAAAGGNDFDIWYQNVDGTDPRQLVLNDSPGSAEYNPNISGDLIAFERVLAGATDADIYVYQLANRTLFHLRDTPGIDETLNDISVEGNQAWVVWAAADGLALGNNDVWAATFTVVAPPTCEDPGDPQPDDDDGHPDDDDDGGWHDDDDDGHDDDDDGHHYDDDDCRGHDDDDDGRGHRKYGHGNEGRRHGSVEVCLNPGDRPLLGSVSVTRTRGKPDVASSTFAADENEEAVVCVYNQQATAGAVHLNHQLVSGFVSFKHKTEVIARSARLQSVNKLHASIAGKPGSSFEVKVYGETQACRTSTLKQGLGGHNLKSADDINSLASGLKIPGSAGVMQTIRGVQVNSLSNGMRVVDQDPVVPAAQAMGCSTSGGNAMAVGVILLAALWVMGRRTPVRVRATRRRR